MRHGFAVVLLVALAACGAQTPAAEPSTATAPTAPGSPSPTPSAPTPSVPTATATSPDSLPLATPTRPYDADPRWRFYTDDRAWHTSPWFAGRHRVMIGFGCNTAPWYSPDPRCPGRQGFHHGIDVAMPCGTRLFSGVAGVVLDPSSPGAPGSAYGSSAFRIRSDGHDILIGHTRPPSVRPGDRVERGQPIALASDSAAPDGCHLHFEVRRAGGGVSAAVDPSAWLDLG
jgi:murein DD-endopeptidase MepM/ murein hydrolase activator NlpD